MKSNSEILEVRKLLLWRFQMFWNLILMIFLQCFKAEIYQNSEFRTSKLVNNGHIWVSKICQKWFHEKSDFHTVKFSYENIASKSWIFPWNWTYIIFLNSFWSFSQKIRQIKVWKFHEFAIIQILREINFGDSRSAKSAFLTHFEALNLDFLWIFALLGLKFTKSRGSEL